MSSLKRWIIASLTEHPDAEKKYRPAALDNPAQLAQDLAQRQALTKADFLSLDDEGKPFIDSAGAWKNFDKIAELVKLAGEKFTYEDFMGQLPGANKTLMGSANANSSLDKIFTFATWQGRFEEMEKLWYELSSTTRSQGATYWLSVKREMYAAEGKTTPEDSLANAKLSQTDIRSAAMSDVTFNDVVRKLQQAGDYFRKEYALLPNSFGDTIFDQKGAFTRFEAIAKIMQAHGERFEVKDYLRQLSTRQSLLERAAEQNALNKIFTPELWVGHLPEMLELWSHVKDAWKRTPMTAQDFDKYYAEAEAQTYAKAYAKLFVENKADLLTPLNKAPGEKPVLPLGLKVVWDSMEEIRRKLEQKGEVLTIQDLHAPSGQMGDSCLISAVKFGYFDKVLEIAQQSSQPLTLNDYLTKDGHGKTLIALLAEKRQLAKVFTVDAWTGHIGDMGKLWEEVPQAYRTQVNFDDLYTLVRQATLNKQSKPGGVKIPRKYTGANLAA